MPNSGSDWLATCIAEVSGLPYKRQFFSPVENKRWHRRVSSEFGDELADTTRRIATKVTLENGRGYFAYVAWMQSSYRFTKEVYSAFKHPFYVHTGRFKVMYLVRSAGETFPPTRGRVVTWYSAIYASLREAVALNMADRDVADDFRAVQGIAESDREMKCLAAHLIASRQIYRDGGSRVIEMDLLASLARNGEASALTGYLRDRSPSSLVDAGQLAERLIATVKPTPRPSTDSLEWKFMDVDQRYAELRKAIECFPRSTEQLPLSH